MHKNVFNLLQDRNRWDENAGKTYTDAVITVSWSIHHECNNNRELMALNCGMLPLPLKPSWRLLWAYDDSTTIIILCHIYLGISCRRQPVHPVSDSSSWFLQTHTNPWQPSRVQEILPTDEQGDNYYFAVTCGHGVLLSIIISTALLRRSITFLHLKYTLWVSGL